MTETPNHSGIAHLLVPALQGSLVGQILRDRGISLCEIDEIDPVQVKTILAELLDLGIDFSQVTEHLVDCECRVLADPAITERAVISLSTLLWTCLGDPSKNGEDAPAIYKQTAQIAYVWFLSVLNPNIIIVPSND